VARREYHHAIDVLEGLVVSQLFQLTKMTQSGLCYKLQVKIAQALKVRTGAICTVVEKYNQAAEALLEHRAPLDVKDILEYVFLSEFDLLRDLCHHVTQKLWVRTGECEALNTYFKILCSQEELERVCIEAHQLQTWMVNETDHMHDVLKELQGANSALAGELVQHIKYRVSVNERH
ncbi:hypothetical protein K439DRAFT_1272013, partial [Ramaria rubella]